MKQQSLQRIFTGLATVVLSTVVGVASVSAEVPAPEVNRKAASWPKNAGKTTIVMVGHGHIDPVWLWPWTEGVSVVHSTFRSALDRMNESGDVVFVSSSAQFYEWVAENDPGMLSEIRRRIKEGRWNVVGGWWVEPDVNLPSGEALVRQGLYGQRTLEKLVGVRATTAFNPDSFGHPGTLPQIISKQGMENYVFMRPNPDEKSIPSDLFRWESPDGSSVLTYRIQQSYNIGNAEEARGRLDRILALAPGQPMTDFMAFYGMGDHGGGPTREVIRAIEGMKAEKGAPAIKHGSVDGYFTDIRSQNLKIPTLKDDLQFHAVGCYSAESEIKKNNRLSETAMVTAEKIAAIGSTFWGAGYPKENFTNAWKRLLFQQFHDGLAGSSVSGHSQDAREAYNYALNVAHVSTVMAVQKLEWQIPSEDPASEYVVVFNPHAWDVTTNVEYDVRNMVVNPLVTDDTGKILPSQYVQPQSLAGRNRALFTTTVPAMGYRQIRIRGTRESTPSKVGITANTIENEYYRITFSADGAIGIFDKEAGREVFEGGATGGRGVIINDPSDTWSHEVRDFTKSTDGPYNYRTKGEIGAFGNATFKILERGPMRAAMRVESTYGDSGMSIDWMLSAGSRNIEARVTLDWHEKLKMVKFSFPVDVEAPESTYEIAYGNIVKEANGEERPGQRWIDVTGRRGDGTYGLTLFNDAKYGYSVNGSDMRITVSRSAPYAYHGPATLKEKDPEGNAFWQDQGIQTMRLLIAPHKGGWRDINAPRMAEEFIQPPVTIYQGIHGGTMAKSASFLSVDAPNVIATAVKMSEEANDGIVRLVETMGREAAVTVRFPTTDFGWSGKIKPYEIKTLRIDTRYGNIREVNLLEE